MKQLMLSDFKEQHKHKRNAYYKVLDFIGSDRCRDGVVCVMFGLRGTGKTTVMQQVMTDNADKYAFEFWEASANDIMDDIYACLDKAIDNKTDCVFVNEITRVPDFIDNAALLADIYAKEGLRIILSGTDTLSFVFAESHSLFDRAVNINTTYISFDEHCRVLGAKDMDDYISYGGLMKKGLIKDRIVHDYQSACRYLDDAVSGNISRSLHKLSRYANHTELFDVPEKEVAAVVKKMVEKLSGTINIDTINEKLKKVVLSFPPDTKEFKDLEGVGVEVFSTLKANEPNIVEEFAKAIHADTEITHKWDNKRITRLENELIRLGFISAITNREYVYDNRSGRYIEQDNKDYYLIQPAIKYYHLKKALDFVKSNEYYKELTETERQYVMDKLDSKIRGDMAAQIVVFETSNALSPDKYMMCKVSFSGANHGGYDMLIYDKAANSYFAFVIVLTAEPLNEQYRHLLDKGFKEIADYKYGSREGAVVLYNGKSFKTPLEILYLNTADFIKEITRSKDIKTTLQMMV